MVNFRDEALSETSLGLLEASEKITQLAQPCGLRYFASLTLSVTSGAKIWNAKMGLLNYL